MALLESSHGIADLAMMQMAHFLYSVFFGEVILWFMKSQTLLSASEQMSLCYDIINMIDMMKSNKSMWWDADLGPGNAELTVVIYFQGMTEWKLHIWPTASSIHHHHHHRSLRGNEADTGLIVEGRWVMQRNEASYINITYIGSIFITICSS